MTGTRDDETQGQAPSHAETADTSATESVPSLPAHALRALAEAEQRRRAQAERDRPAEVGGRDGPDPVRYGDWEKGGITSDF